MCLLTSYYLLLNLTGGSWLVYGHKISKAQNTRTKWTWNWSWEGKWWEFMRCQFLANQVYMQCTLQTWMPANNHSNPTYNLQDVIGRPITSWPDWPIRLTTRDIYTIYWCSTSYLASPADVLRGSSRGAGMNAWRTPKDVCGGGHNLLDSENDFRSGCQNISQCHPQTVLLRKSYTHLDDHNLRTCVL